MTELVLDREQSLQVTDADGEIVVRDDSGRTLGVLTRVPDGPERISLSADEIEMIIRRMSEPVEGFRTTEEVIARIKARIAS